MACLNNPNKQNFQTFDYSNHEQTNCAELISEVIRGKRIKHHQRCSGRTLSYINSFEKCVCFSARNHHSRSGFLVQSNISTGVGLLMLSGIKNY